MHTSEELMVEHALRKKIRKRILESLEVKKQEEKKLLEEELLRKMVREVISEAVGQSASPHTSTGINTLEDLLKKIIPVLEKDYKRLTTSEDQRQSFRAHIINAVENSLAPLDANSEIERPGGEEPNIGPDQEEASIDLEPEPMKESMESLFEDDLPPDQNKFIDINSKPEKEQKEEPRDPREDFGVDGLEVTGRNFAYSTYKKIEKQIGDAYSLLGSGEDKEMFFDYLITNLKLYFDRFEEELTPNVNEPTTPEYEAQLGKELPQDAMMENVLSEKILEMVLNHINKRV